MYSNRNSQKTPMFEALSDWKNDDPIHLKMPVRAKTHAPLCLHSMMLRFVRIGFTGLNRIRLDDNRGSSLEAILVG